LLDSEKNKKKKEKEELADVEHPSVRKEERDEPHEKLLCCEELAR
jgi:hypothetical protein